MDYTTIQYSMNSNGIARIRLNRPEVLNASRPDPTPHQAAQALQKRVPLTPTENLLLGS